MSHGQARQLDRPPLHLVDGAPQPFDRVAWLWALRDSPAMAALKPAAMKVIVLAAAMADREGEVDLPAEWVGERIGCKKRATQLAIDALCKPPHPLLDPVPRRNTANRYRLVEPPKGVAPDPNRGVLVYPQATPEAHAVAPAGAHADAHSGARGRILMREGAHSGAPESARACAQSKPKQARKPHACADDDPGDPGATGAPGEAGLFEPPKRQQAAAALLARYGVPIRRANWLITHQRPTVEQIRIVIANGFAWRHAYRTGKTDRPLNDLRGFLIAQVRDGNFLPDDRVERLRQRAWQRVRAMKHRRAQAAGEGTDVLQQIGQEYLMVLSNVGDPLVAERAALAVARRLGVDRERAAKIVQESEAPNG